MKSFKVSIFKSGTSKSGVSKFGMPKVLGWLLIAVICSASANVGDEHVIFDDSFDGENHKPTLALIADQRLQLGGTVSLTASASDPDENNVLVFSLFQAPAGMSIDSVSGQILWTPDASQMGEHLIRVRVDDSQGRYDIKNFIITVTLEQNRAPVAVDDGTYTVERGDTLNVPAPGLLANDSDPDGDTLSAVLDSGPSAGTLDLNSDGSFDYTPDNPTGSIGMKLKWSYKGRGGIPDRTPLIIDLDGDGIPEIVMMDVVGSQTELYAVHGDTGEEYFRVPYYNEPIPGSTAFAAADLDLDGHPEILVIGQEPWREQRGKKLMAFDHTGQLKWVSEALPEKYQTSETQGYGLAYEGDMQFSTITIADIDQDGSPEILVGITTAGLGRIGYQVWDIEGNKLDYVFTNVGTGSSPPTRVEVVDLDLDGVPEIVMGAAAWTNDGQLLWSHPEYSLSFQTSNFFPLIANLDDDPYPEMVRAAGYPKPAGTIVAWNHDGSVLWERSYPVGYYGNYGMISIADVDNDGKADILVPPASWETIPTFRVLNGADGSLKWSQTAPGSGGDTFNTGLSATVMDMDNDGINEVVYLDEVRTFHVWDGRDGTIKLEYPSGETGHSYQSSTPIFADVDGDGHAELVTIGDYSLNPDLIRVYESPEDDWPPMRAIWNQGSYHVTNINDDGTVPQFERPFWLMPGLNQNLINQRLPEERFGSTDSFTYKASDGELASNVATVNFDVQPPNAPPQILSTPGLLTSPGYQYSYGVLAVDGDAGEVLTYVLSPAPAGMTMDVNHLIHWTPTQTDLGDHTIAITVTDSVGVSAQQSYTLTVMAAVTVPNVVGETELAAATSLTAGNLSKGSIQFAAHPTIAVGSVSAQTPAAGSVVAAGSGVNLIISSGPGPADTDHDSDGFTPNQGDCNDADSSIKPGAIDPPGDGIDQDCDGIDGNLTLSEILVLPKVSTLLTYQNVKLKAIGIFADGTSQNLTGIVSWSAGPVFSSATAGNFTVSATRGSVSGSADIHVLGRVGGDTVAPTAEITTPANDDTITAPIDVVGSASDVNFLKYELAYALADSETFTTITTSTTPVNNGVLGTFDPTLLLNNLYTLRLTVFDLSGKQSVAETSIVVDGDLKVGNFSLSFTDLSVPMSGIPITVTRNYDSRNKSVGDFGVGWNLAINTLKLRTTGALGADWHVDHSGLAYILVADKPHVLSLTLANGQVEVFDLVVSPDVSPAVPFPVSSITASYQARPGTMGRLESLENNILAIIDQQPGDVDLVDDTTFSIYNPDLFRYTQLDGTEVVISRASGVKSVREPSGNLLTFTNSGISHSSGKSITFNRDALGRIKSIVDPNGAIQSYVYDGNGDLRKHTDRVGSVTNYRYNHSHGLIEMDDPLGNRAIRNEYDDDGRLVASTDANGKRIEYAHDIDARQEEITDLRGNLTVYLYDQQGHVISQTDPNGDVTTFIYDAAGNILSTTDPLGNTTSQTYDASNNVLSQTDGLGHTTTHTYNPLGKQLTTTDPLGNVTTFEYSANDNELLKQIDAAGNETSYSYDVKGNVETITDPDGGVTQRSYDSFGNQVTETDTMGNSASFAYDAVGNRTGEVRTRATPGGPELLETISIYNANGLQTSMTMPGGMTVSVEYDAAGRKSAVIDPNGNRTEFAYDGGGNLISETVPGGLAKTKTHDANGNVASMTGLNGKTTSFDYDVLNRLQTVHYADGSSLTNGYDGNGKIVSSTDALGNVISSEFDAAGRKTKVTDALGNATSYTYDDNGNVSSQTDANLNTTNYVYDSLNRRTKTTYADATFTTTSYDGKGNKLTETDQAGLTSSFSYDLMGNLESVTDPMGEVINYVYDELGNKIGQQDANGNLTMWEYDKAGNAVEKTYPDGTSESWSYDGVGNVVSHTDANGFTTTLVYDNNNRLIGKEFPDLTSESFSYTLSGQKASSTNAAGTTNWTYDDLDRVTRIDDPNGGYLVYSYDAMGNRISVTTSVGTTTTTYDAVNRPETVTDANGQVTTYTYDPVGNRASITLPNGTVTTYGYDTLNRLTSVENRKSNNALLSSYTYSLGLAGNRELVTEAGGRLVSYQYDNVYRLTQEAITDPVAGNETISYTYDAHGNRTSKTDSSGTLTYTYDVNDRLMSDGIDTYTYDANGNTLSRVSGVITTLYSYDFENQLIALPNDNVTYAYDPDGVRISQTVAGVVARFVVDTNRDLAQVLEEQTDTGTTIVSYVYGDDLISQDRLGTDAYYIYDGQMSTRALTNLAENITDTYSYDAFGVLLGSTGSTQNNYRYTGEQFDPNSGFYYLRARYYSPEIGRFTIADEFPADMFDPGTLHRYVYVKNNPVNLVDPSGEFFTQISLMVTISIDSTLEKAYVKMLAKSFIQSLKISKCLIEPGVWLLNRGMELISDPHYGNFGALIMQIGNDMIAQGLQKVNEALNEELKDFAESLIPKIKFSFTVAISIPVPKAVAQAHQAYGKYQSLQKKIKDTTEKLKKIESFLSNIASGNQCGQLEFIADSF